MKAIKDHLQKNKPEEVEAFEKNAQAFAKKIVANFKDYEFVRNSSLIARLTSLLTIACFFQYTGEKMDPEGMIALLNYREDGTTRMYTYVCVDVSHYADV